MTLLIGQHDFYALRDLFLYLSYAEITILKITFVPV
jgi:hypothetical protein